MGPSKSSVKAEMHTAFAAVPPGDEAHVRVRLSACLANEFGGVHAVLVGAVAGRLLAVGAQERVEHFGRGALGIVVAELMHGKALPQECERLYGTP